MKPKTGRAGQVIEAAALRRAAPSTRGRHARKQGPRPGSQRPGLPWVFLGLRSPSCPLTPRAGPDFRLGSFTSGDKSLPPPLDKM